MDKFSIQVERNIKGIEYEKTGRLNDAIELYEKNINELFEGNHPYDRLAIIYHKQGEIQKEKEVLEKAIYVFENAVYFERCDRLEKLERFKKRLIRLLNID